VNVKGGEETACAWIGGLMLGRVNEMLGLGFVSEEAKWGVNWLWVYINPKAILKFILLIRIFIEKFKSYIQIN